MSNRGVIAARSPKKLARRNGGRRSAAAPPPDAPPLDAPQLYVNREISLLDFQRRVLEEAQDEAVPLLERVALLLRFGLLGRSVRQFCGDQLFPRIDGIENRLVEKALQQPHQDEEVERLRTDGEPVDEHGYFPAV